MKTEKLDDLIKSVYRYALSLTQDNDFAHDLVQDSCIKVMDGDKEWSFETFAAIVRQKFIELYRNNQNFSFKSLWELDVNVEEDDSLYSVDPILEIALDNLDYEERELMYLSVCQGFSLREISKLNGKRRGFISYKIQGAKFKIQAMLSDRTVKNI